MFAHYSIKDKILDSVLNKFNLYEDGVILLAEKIKKAQKLNYNNILKEIKTSLPKEGEILNMENIADKWFPQPRKYPRIFISHAHVDNRYVSILVGILKSMGIDCFVDSWVWGHIRELQLMLDKEHSEIKKNLYKYDNTLYISSLLNTLLISSLTKVINEAECMIFIKTDKSTITHNEHSFLDKNEIGTGSPWIYIENIIINFIEKMKPDYIPFVSIHSSLPKPSLSLESTAGLKPLFPIKDFPEINEKTIGDMLIECSKQKNPNRVLLKLYSSLEKGWSNSFPQHKIEK